MYLSHFTLLHMNMEPTDSQLVASFFDQQPQPAFWMTPVFSDNQQIIDFEYRYCNKEFYVYTGLAPEVIINSRVSTSPAISSQDTRKDLFNELLNVYESGDRMQAWLYNPGFDKYYSYTRNRVEGGVLTVLQDRTEERKMMRETEEQKAFVDNLLKNSSNAISVSRVFRDESGKIVDAQTIHANDAAVKHIGLPKEIYLTKRASEIEPAVLISPYYKACINTLETGEPFVTQYQMQSTGRWLELTVSKLDNDHLIHVFSDVTAIKQAQLQLEGAVERLQAVFDASQSGIFTFSPVHDDRGEVIDFRFVIANPTFAAYVGQTPGTLKGELGSTFFPGYLHNGVFDMYKKTYLTGETLRQDIHYNVDEHDLYLDLLSTKVQDEVLVTFTDYTRITKLHHQIEQTVDELTRSNKNLEDFAYAASHDMKEPIRKIHFFADRLKEQLKDQLNEEQKHSFERLENASHRMRTLIDDLLAYSQATKGIPHIAEIDLNKKMQLVLEDLEIEIDQKRALIEVDKLPTIDGNKRQLQQLFQNLITNALKYSKAGIQPVIKISAEEVEGRDVGINLTATEQEKYYHLIKVRDNGIGFEQQDAERIFNVFTRLHGSAEYKGTGVGLSIVRKVVENHNGYIWAESSPGEGATFNILLPKK